MTAARLKSSSRPWSISPCCTAGDDNACLPLPEGPARVYRQLEQGFRRHGMKAFVYLRPEKWGRGKLDISLRIDVFQITGDDGLQYRGEFTGLIYSGANATESPRRQLGLDLAFGYCETRETLCSTSLRSSRLPCPLTQRSKVFLRRHHPTSEVQAVRLLSSRTVSLQASMSGDMQISIGASRSRLRRSSQSAQYQSRWCVWS